MKPIRIGLFSLVALGLAGGVLVSCAALGVGDNRPGTALDQGWTVSDVTRWYDAYQGSRLLPASWFRALEQPDSESLFLDDAYIGRFGYLTRRGQLPVGFAIDNQNATGLPHTSLVWKTGQRPTEPWVGLTCSACHTSEIRSGGNTFRIEGGATLADFQSFIEAVNAALVKTRGDAAKFDRFAARVLGSGASADDKARLKTALDTLTTYQLKIAGMNTSHIRYGYGRLDAQGFIFNKVALIVDPDKPKGNEPAAPVSYPFLWNTSQQTQVQWNGIARNEPRFFSGARTFDLGALGRNFGEVTGVFGDISLGAGGRSSIQVNNLVAIEQQLMRLKPPRWPREVFPVDQALADEGKALFTARCAACHLDLKRSDLVTRARADGAPIEQMSYFQPRKPTETKVDTDPWMACDSALFQINTGSLAGATTGVAGEPTLTASEPAALVLRTFIIQTLKKQAPQVAVAGVESYFGVLPPPQFVSFALAAHGVLGAPQPPVQPAFLTECKQYAASANYAVVAYKARPLAGAWATGPFLHNGSVPTLYDLLLAPAKRPTLFNLGTREFDPKHVGFVTTPGPGNDFVFRVNTVGGAPVQGNSNQGHDYDNASLSEHDRLALVEYLKIIGE